LATLFLLSLVIPYAAKQPVSAQTVIDTIKLGEAGYQPFGIAVNPSTNRIYTANEANNTVSVIDGATNSIVATVSVGSGPCGVAVNPNTNRIYTANHWSDTVSVIDGATNSVVATVSVGAIPYGVAVSSITNRIYVANQGNATVSVIDGATNSVVATVVLVTNVYDVAVNPNTNRIYTANDGSNNVSVIDGNTNSEVAMVSVGGYPDDIAVNPSINRIYTANEANNTVSVIDGATNNVVATVSVGSTPKGVAVNPSTNRIYATNYGSDTVSVIWDPGPIDTVPPTVTVTQPNGGELWSADSTENIIWNATDNLPGNLNYLIEYSTDGGSTWLVITNLSGKPQGVSSFTWTVPAVNSTNCKVKITATDSAGYSNSDISDNTFTIFPATGQKVYIPSTIRVLMDDGTVKPMSLEEYLRGVVYTETGPCYVKSFTLNDEQTLQVLRAQAVAARTYACAKILGIKSKCNRCIGTEADVCTRSCCQRWSKPLAYSELSDQAVRDTCNEVITYNGKLIISEYSAVCGGLTNSGPPYLPYFQSIICPCKDFWQDKPDYNRLKNESHHRGMCQWGAFAKAKQGDKYKDIIKYYYNKVEIAVGTAADNLLVATIHSPAELRVYDSIGHVTGLVNGEIKEEIPDSSYDEIHNSITIYALPNSYSYKVVGTSEGNYGLTLAAVIEQEILKFVAVEIPISDGVTHMYTCDWDALSQGKEGVTVQVDLDGDGKFEVTFTPDGELTGNEFLLQTRIPPAAPPAAPRSSPPIPTPPRILNPAQMSVRYLSVSPQQTYANQPVTITTNVVNTGDESGNYNVLLKINGQVEQMRMVSVGPQGTQPAQFTVTKAQPGIYTVSIDGQQSKFTVLDAGKSTGSHGSGGLIAILIMSILIIATVVLLMLTFRRPV
jgi:YVTN family beta-propeller protein